MTEHPLLAGFRAELEGRLAAGTVDAYHRAVRDYIAWAALQPEAAGSFRLALFTREQVQTYIDRLEPDHRPAHLIVVKSGLSRYAKWLIRQGKLEQNPTYGVVVPAQKLHRPRVLSPEQRSTLLSLVARDGSARTGALFACGYHAGFRVSDTSYLLLKNCEITAKQGVVTVGHKGSKTRTILLAAPARAALYAYLQEHEEDAEREYVFSSQRAARLSERGIHHWFRALKSSGTPAEADLLEGVTYHDLRHDFAHRLREAGWTLEQIAVYLGHITRKGTPALSSTLRYVQPNRAVFAEMLGVLAVADRRVQQSEGVIENKEFV